MEHQLDRSRPLWETWVVEGVEGDRFALINKIHHCILDGHGGVDLSQSLLSLTPDRDIREAPRFLPRPEPSSSELLVNEWRHRLATPIDGLSNLYRFVRKARDPVGEVGRQIRSLGEMASWKALPASETPMNGEIGPHRICDWRTMPLEQLKAVKKALGCTINDVVLTVTTTAVRELMQHRQVRPEELDFRVSTPVSVRPKGSEGDLGNHVSSWIIRLPLGEPDPLEQLEIVRASTQELKRSNQASAIELVNAVVDWMPFDLQAASRGTVNMIVSNVPGPPFPLYILGAEMQEIIPLPPLIDNVGLAIGLLSYNGQLSWGFNADYDRLPDLADFATGVVDAFERLAEAAGVDLEAVETTKQLPAPEGGELQSWLDPAVAGTPSPAEGEAEPVRTAVGAADG
jgi:WS/DGAT/MGAT family acyltransferase